jgi:Fe-S cluster assembly iron-binding protein IscA
MINVTEKAAEALDSTLQENQPEQTDQLLRLRASEQGFSLTLDEQRAGDQVISCNDKPVMLVDAAVSSQLDGAVVDVVSTPDGSQLVIQSAAT